jgi:hypothetical protein
MVTSTKSHGDLFYRTLATVAMVVPILLVFAAGTLPEGVGQRGHLIVYGHEFLVVVLATGLVLRAVYSSGFNSALQKLQTRSLIAHVTA